MTTTPVPTAPPVVRKFAATQGSDAPERVVSESGQTYAPLGVFFTFGADNTVLGVSLSAAPANGDSGRVDWEKDRTIAYDKDEPWVQKLGSMVSPAPTQPGNYVTFDTRSMTFPPVWSLNAHGEWYGSGGRVTPSELPQGLVRKS